MSPCGRVIRAPASCGEESLLFCQPLFCLEVDLGE